MNSCLSFREQGVKGLYKGLEAKLLQTVSTAALMFVTYEKIAAFIFRLLRRTQRWSLQWIFKIYNIQCFILSHRTKNRCSRRTFVSDASKWSFSPKLAHWSHFLHLLWKDMLWDFTAVRKHFNEMLFMGACCVFYLLHIPNSFSNELFLNITVKSILLHCSSIVMWDSVAFFKEIIVPLSDYERS